MPDSFFLAPGQSPGRLTGRLRRVRSAPAPACLGLLDLPAPTCSKRFSHSFARPLTRLRLRFCLLLVFAMLEKLHLLQPFLCRTQCLVGSSKIFSLAGNDLVPPLYFFFHGHF